MSYRPLGVLLHIVQVGCHDEVFRVDQAVLVCMLLPTPIITLVSDVTLATPCFKLPEVQPCLVVLREREEQEF
jgi:hypothetical protein